MTLNEFKAWLEGFEASFADGSPNPEQWAAVKGKLATVGGAANIPLPKTPPPYVPFAPYVPPRTPVDDPFDVFKGLKPAKVWYSDRTSCATPAGGAA